MADDLLSNGKAFVDPSSTPLSNGKPFLDPADVRSAPGEVLAGVKRGLYGAAKGAGASLQAPAEQAGQEPGLISGAGKALEDFGTAGINRNEAQPDQHGVVTNTLAKIPEIVGSSLPAIGAFSVGSLAGGPLLGGAAAGAAQAGEQAWHERYQAALAAGQDDASARDYAAGSGTIAAAAMGALPLVGKGAGIAAGAAGKALGFGAKDATMAAADIVGKKFAPELGKSAAEMTAGNVAAGAGQAAAQAQLDTQHNMGDEDPVKAALASIPDSLVASVGFLPFSVLHASGNVKAAKAKAALLADPASDPAARDAVIREVYDGMKKVDPDGANMWAVNAAEAKTAGVPIGVDDSWTTGPHPTAWPQLPAPKPIIAGAPIESAVAEPSPAEQANDARWAERDRLAASGPLGLAAARGMDSGAVDTAAAQRAADIGGAGEPPAPPAGGGGSPAEQQAQLNLTSWTRATQPLSLAEAQRNADAIEPGAHTFTIVPHPSGDGYAVVPDRLITPEMKDQYAGLQRPALPGPRTETGVMTGREGLGGAGTEPQRFGDREPTTNTFPFPTPEAARNRADAMTMRTGVEHEVVPHPYASEKFAVRPKADVQESPPSTEREQPVQDQQLSEKDVQISDTNEPNAREFPATTEETDHALQEPSTGALLQREPIEAGVAGGERGRVQPGEQGQAIAGENQAAGAQQGAEKGLQADVTEHLTKPSFEAADAFDAQQIPHDSPEAAGVSRIVAEGRASGAVHPDALRGISIHTFDDSHPESAGAIMYPDGRSMGLGADVLRRAAAGDKTAIADGQYYVAHELGHTEDMTPDRTFKSAEHPAFEINSGSDASERTPTGGIIAEAYDAYNKGGLAHEFLKYPLADMESTAHDLKLSSEAQVRKYLQAETFAQLSAMYKLHPAEMRAELPKAFDLFDRINHGKEQSGHDVDAARRAVLAALRDTGADGSAKVNAERASGEPAGVGAGERNAGVVERGSEQQRTGGGAQFARKRESVAAPDLVGLPKTSPGSFEPARKAAASYMRAAGLKYRPPTTFERVDPEFSKRIADAYEAMKDEPENPRVKKAYRALIKETVAQWHAMMKTGLKVDFTSDSRPYPYKSPMDAVRDVRDNNHLTVFATEGGFGSGARVNIGLDIPGGGRLKPAEVIKALRDAGVSVESHVVKASATEPTFIASIKPALTERQAHDVSAALKQESIAQHDGIKGELYGPKADAWRPFNGDYFLDENGKPIGNQHNPLLDPTDIKVDGRTLLANDVFRAVHDYFGHVKEGVGFRHDGEENAWRSHAAMYSDVARQAMTTETRGQNSWVNFGPHGEHNRTATDDTIYGDQKTGLLPKIFTADHYEDLPPEIAKTLTPEERTLVGEGRDRAVALMDTMAQMPEDKFFDQAAKDGAAARKWYSRSLEAITKVYGDDTPRFMSLMAALSPQTNVKMNFHNAARVYAAWEKAGRPTDNATLRKIFTKNLVKDTSREEGKNAMEAWVQNGIRALTATDPLKIKLSGPKVSSFMANLLGHLNEVTNDLHMADFGGIPQKVFAGQKTKASEGLGAKGPGYLAMSAKVRASAARLGWAPAEVQAAIWSWWNSLKKLSNETKRSAVDLLNDGSLTQARIAAEPHLGSYLNAAEFRNIDPARASRAGRTDDGEHGQADEQGSAADGGNGPSADTIANAERLDKLTGRDVARKALDADDDYVPFARKRTPEDVAKLDALKADIKNLMLITGGEMTGPESKRFIALTNELNALRHDIGKADTAAQVDVTPAESKSTLTPETYATISGDVWRDKDIHLALAEASTGVSFNADTAIDRIFDGHNKAVSPQAMYDNFDGTREALQKQYGDVLTLYRATGKQKDKTTQNFATTREFAAQFGPNVIERAVPVRDVLAANVAGRGRYHELIVGNAEKLGLVKDYTPFAQKRPVFYSGLDRAIDEKAPFAKDGTISAQMLRNWIESKSKEGIVKRDEVQWTGLDDYLKLQDGKITRAQLKEFLDNNGVKVTETELGHEQPWRTRLDMLETRGATNLGPEEIRELETLREQRVEAMMDGNAGIERNTTKFHDYQLPGGKNYKELLLTLPDTRSAKDQMSEKVGAEYNKLMLQGTAESMAKAKALLPQYSRPAEPQFQSSHFDQPNILAHIRFNDRTDADGKKVLFIEELQSDWAQQGRKEGFKHENPSFTIERSRDGENFKAMLGDRAMGMGATEQEAIDAAERNNSRDGIPAAPFVGKTEAWTALALKRMIRYAAENGYDRVSWTSGEQQSNRYDLSKQVGSIHYTQDGVGAGTLLAMPVGVGIDTPTHTRQSLIERDDVRPEDLPDIIGKEAAERLMKKPIGANGFRSIDGSDLKVGGEGMKAFYDKIVPNVANDVLKKLGGGRVGEVQLGDHGYGVTRVIGKGWQVVDAKNLPVNDRTFKDQQDALRWIVENDPTRKQPGFDITPGMKAKVLEGQPMFARKRDGRKVPDKDLMTKVTGGKAAAAEQQFTKNGEPVADAPVTGQPDWVAKASPAAQEFLRKAGVYVPKLSWRERWAAIKKDLGLKVIQATVDQYAPVLQNIGRYSYQLLRMASSSDNGLATLVDHGHVELNNYGALKVKADTPSLRAIMAPLKGEHDRMLAWMAAQRAQELMREGREHNFTTEEIAAGLKLNTQMHADDKFAGEGSRAMAYAKAMKEFSAMNKSVLDVAEKAGLLDADVRKSFEREFYVPFFRESDDGKNVNPSNISGMVNQYATKRLKGGTDQLHDLMANTMQNWSHLLSAALKNNAAWHTLEEAEAKGIAHRVKSDEKGSMFVKQFGKDVHWLVDDPLVSQAISSLSAVPFRGPVMAALSKFKHVLTAGVTLSPTFRINNVIRDQIAATAANPTSYNFVKNMIEGFKYSSRNNPEYANMLAGGAFIRMGQDLGDNRGAYVKRLINEGIDAKSILDSDHKVSAALGQMWDWWQETGERSESLTRAELYRQTFASMIKAGKDPELAHFEASYIAKDSMDFSLHGTSAAIRMLTQVVPFMNARLQGLYKLQRGASADPKRFAAVIGGVTLATIALTLAYRDDEDMKRRSEWDRDNFWGFKIGDKMLRIPKPFEIGAMATVIDRGLEAAMDGLTPTARERFVSRLGPIIGNQLNMNPIPQAVAPIIQLWGNQSWFTNQQIETEREQNLPTSERYGPRTSATAIALGKAGILSPEQIDFLVNSYLGWAGNHAIATADLALRPAMGLPSQPTDIVNNYFVLGDFVKQMPSSQSRFTEQYYDHLKGIQEAFGEMRLLQETGQTERLASLLKDRGDEIGLAGLYNRTSRQIGKLNQRARYVSMSGADPDQKREQLDRIAQLKNRLTEVAETARARALDSR